jgi:hypothetical protein
MSNNLLLSLFNFLVPVYNDAPEPWQLSFQDGENEAPNPIIILSNNIIRILILAPVNPVGAVYQ